MTGVQASARLPVRLKTAGVGLALVVIAFGLTLLLRQSGAMQALEWGAYDTLFALTGDMPPAAGSDIVLIAFTEADETLYGSPLPDAVLAALLSKLATQNPLAIGLDLIRDRPEPPLAVGEPERPLQTILRETGNLVGIVKDTEPRFAGPPGLAGQDHRLGAADIISDGDGVVRRGLLYISANGKTRPTLALQLATRRLQQEGIESAWLDDHVQLGATTYQPLIPSRTGYYQDPALDGGYQFLLRYPACEEAFARYPVRDIVEPGEMPDLAGKIVLIGNMLALSKDLFTAPDNCSELAGNRLFGVDLHAQITAQLIAQATGAIRPPSTTGQLIGDVDSGRWLDGLWICLWCALGVLLVMAARRLLPLLITVVTALTGLFLLACGGFAALGWWLPLLPPAAGFALAASLTFAFTLMTTRSERDTFEELLAGVVSKRVADALWHQRASWGKDGRAPPELMTATVMFTDIKGFTTISEQLPEPILAKWLNEYLETMVDIVAAHDGVIEKFAGDGLTIEFGPPDRRTTVAEIEADARSAMASALAMEASLLALNCSWRERGLPEIGIRIGIHTGELMAGAIGSASRFQYSIIGDTANTAARLEAYGKDDPALQADVGECRILLSETTYQYLGKDIDVDFVGQVSLRGKANDVAVYRAITPGMAENGQQKELKR